MHRKKNRRFLHSVNPSLTAILVERSKLVKSRFSKFIVADDEAVFYEHRRTILDSKQRQSCQLRLLRRDADPLWVEFDSMPSGADEDDPGLRITIVDITERKRLEEEILKARKLE